LNFASAGNETARVIWIIFSPVKWAIFALKSVRDGSSQTLWVHPSFRLGHTRAGLCGAHFRCHSLTDCVTLEHGSTSFWPVEFKFAILDFALPAPLVWVVYAHVPFRKFYSALWVIARFLEGRRSAPGVLPCKQKVRLACQQHGPWPPGQPSTQAQRSRSIFSWSSFFIRKVRVPANVPRSTSVSFPPPRVSL
jgi:hypothetical protein